MYDNLGDRMKRYESIETERYFDSDFPLLARVDGRAFHTLTKDMHKPFDIKFTECMMDTARYLVQETNAILGYVQSDEISLLWHGVMPFDGRIFKIVSMLSALASVKFSSMLGFGFPTFDARAWQVPDREEATNVFVWRELDARRNSIQMVAQSIFPQSELFGKDTDDLTEMLNKRGVSIDDYEEVFVRGSYWRRVAEKRKFFAWELDSLPTKHNARKNPDIEYERSKVMRVPMPELAKAKNRVELIFGK